ncbi:MAG TPA: hypothetical protein VIL86_11030 [Tepidisphaeraceae bacterium]|jgi:hypothetical protein
MEQRIIRLSCIVFLLFGIGIAAPMRAAEPSTRPALPATRPAAADSEKFLRFIDDGRHGGRLETADVTYRNGRGVTVHLIAAVHIADAAYYAGLAHTFEQFDPLLFEMVLPRGAKPPKPDPARSPRSTVGSIQKFLGDNLDLAYQLDGIDYTKSNFVHADMDVETYEDLSEQRGETPLTLAMRNMLANMNNPELLAEQPSMGEVLLALVAPDRARRYKMILARQFGHIEASIAGLNGKNGTVILTERNKTALKALRQQIDAGKTNLALFYGAAHMPDLEEHLTKKMGFKKIKTEWRTAWDLTAPPTPTTRPTTRSTTLPAAAPPIE